MEINLKEINEITVVQLSGELDSNTSPEAESAINEKLKSGVKKMIVNFIDLDYISSAGLRVMLATAKKITAKDGELVICGLNEVVQEVFDMSGFSTILNLADDEAAALDELS